jgi:hypothetical protein
MSGWRCVFTTAALALLVACGNGHRTAGDGDVTPVDGEGTDTPDALDGADPVSDPVPDTSPDADLTPDEAEDEIEDCYAPVPSRELAVLTGGGGPLSFDGAAFVVLTGTFPADVGGMPVEAVRVAGSGRNVHVDGAAGVWTWMRYLADTDTDIAVEAVDAGGSVLASTSVRVSAGAAAPLPDDFRFYPADHVVGSWMFTWFTGDPGWACSSPWAPPETFALWNGSPEWARKQMLDQMDANIDVIGLQMDWKDETTARAYRWVNVRNAIEAARLLLEDGMQPPRIFPLVDTAIIASFFEEDNARTMNLGNASDLDFFYGHMQAFYTAMRGMMGVPFTPIAGAEMGGKPFVGLWHSVTIDGESNGVVAALKGRFLADFGVEPHFVAHPNDWSALSGIDEITLMFGPPQHFFAGGRDVNGGETINIEAGFWNPVSNTFYLPRQGGVNFLAAWEQALARRADVEHLYIDSWNETGEGSGIFEAQPVSYTAADTGPCGTFVNLHDDSWGDGARFYIDTVSQNAALWNDAAELDGVVVASDLPAAMGPGERRWVSVVVRNQGDTPWEDDGTFTFGPLDGTSEWLVDPQPVALGTAELQHVGRVPRGAVTAFRFLLGAPCGAGAAPLSFQMARSGEPFGEIFTVEILVVP